MSRYLLLNLEDFSLNQDITKTIQPFHPFCICCLDREGPMFDLEKCEHSDYLYGFAQPQMKQFNQLVCFQCHSILMNIKYFQKQVNDTMEILLSGAFTNTTENNRRIKNFSVQKVINDLYLPPDLTQEELKNNITNNFIEYNNIEEIQNNSNLEENFNTITNEGVIPENRPNAEVNKNIKTALEILERNNQNFLSISSPLQFLNGGHLSFLEPSLCSKEILTDLPLVLSENSNTDLDNGLLNSSKSLDIEIDGTDKVYYDLDLSPKIMEKNSLSEIGLDSVLEIQNETKPKTLNTAKKPKLVNREKKITSIMVRRVKLSLEELNKERVLQAQSETYLSYKFRCETCIVGFNYKENLKDHCKRKHGLKEGNSIVCNICCQLIQNPACLTEHNYRHFTRFECAKCSKRFPIHDEAIDHYARNQCGDGHIVDTTKTKRKSSQQKRAKTKQSEATQQ